MGKIDIRFDTLNEAIDKLNKLERKRNSIDISPPTTVGGGMTVNEMEEIASEYKKLHAALGTLITNTSLFLQNVRDSFQEIDETAAESISQ